MDCNFLKETVFKTVEFRFDKEIVFYSYDGIRVSYDGTRAKIGASTEAGFARGCFLLAMQVSEGKTELEIEEHPCFKDCGVMLDCSRNGVMKVEAVKQYINCMASLGMNMLLLYTEDTYEIEGRPLFGYMRGRYSKEELREIVAYGEKMGVELIPCIQTLGHMRQYLKWSNSGGPDYTGEQIGDMRDTAEVLLCGAEETYRFIEDAIRACREAYNTKRIHIGMDEAGGIGTGRYLRKNGYHNPYEILKKHLDMVVKICEKYDFKPMIWSDMFFRLSTGGYNRYDFDFPEGLKEQIPNAQLVYWEYYNDQTELYDGMLRKHKELSDDIAFAGGIGTWYGFLVPHEFSYLNSVSAMKSCLSNGIQTVFATLWGDDGNETNAFLSNSLLPVYSEYCYKGEACTETDIAKASEYLTKIAFEDAKAMGSFSFLKEDEYLKEWRQANGGGKDILIGKRLFYGDVLYDLSVRQTSCNVIMEIYNTSVKRMALLEQAGDKNSQYYRYAYLLFRIGSVKAELVRNLRPEYRKGNREYLKKVRDEYLPQLAAWYEAFAACHKKQWHEVYKPFGYEVLSFRYGGIVARLKDVMETIDQYLKQEISRIEELEEDVVFVEEGYLVGAATVAAPSVVF